MTYHNIRTQYGRNATQLEKLAERAEKTGRKVNGMAADFWHEKARIYRALSVADDTTIAAQLSASRQSVSDRLQELRQPETGVPPYEVRKQLREATLEVGRRDS